MLVLERQPTAGPSGSAPAGGVRLRLNGGQVMELPRGKTTIGSSPRCNLRIQEPGVQPLHCLILNAGQGLTVRRWAGETNLNGRRLDESLVAVGDRLQVGPVELEVIGATEGERVTNVAPTTPATTAKAKAAFGMKANVASIPSQVSCVSEPSAEIVAPLTKCRDSARARSRKLLAALRRDRAVQLEAAEMLTKLRRQIEMASAQRDAAAAGQREVEEQLNNFRQQVELAAAQRDSQAGEFRAMSAELAAVRKRVKEQESAIVAYQPMAVRNEHLTRKAEVLEARLSEMAGQLDAAEQAWKSLTEKEATLSADIQFAEEENARLKQCSDELTGQKGTLVRERDELRRQIEQLQANLQWADGEKGGLQSNLQTLVGEKSQLENERRELSEKLANLYAELDRAAAENARLTQMTDEYTSRSSAVGSERDQLLRRAEELQANLQWIGGEKTALENEHRTLTERIAAVTGELEQIASEKLRLEKLNSELAEQNGAVRRERDELRRREETLQAENSRLLQLADDLRGQSSAIADERDRLGELTKDLQNQLQIVADEKAALASECERLRRDNGNIAELEQQVRAAVAERESTSSELFRALLQLAETQERDDSNQALTAAHRALDEELEKSASEVAELTAQVERLSAQQAEAEAARLVLAQQQAATAEAQVQLANEKCALEETAAELRGELMEACEREAQYVAQLRSADEWRQKFEAAARNETALNESLAELEVRLAGKQESDEDAARRAAERDGQVAEYERSLAAASDSIAELQGQLADAVDAHRNVELSRDLWENERAGFEKERTAQRELIATLEARLAEAQEVLASRSAQALVEVPISYDPLKNHDSSVSTDEDSQDVEAPPELFSLGPTETAKEFASDPQEQLVDESGFGGNTSSATEDSGFGATANRTTDPTEASSPSRRGPFDKVAKRDRESAEGEVAPATQPASFIDRYSHIFADDRSAVDATAAPPALRPQGTDDRQHQQKSPTVVSGRLGTPATGDDEDSIEQYMAKLMQRVRGDGQPSVGPASQAPPVTQQPISGPLGYEPPAMQADHPMTLSAISLRDSLIAANEADGAAPPQGPRRKSSMPAPQTDLEALRALANESARRAISRHSLRKYRRTALTKVIVSALAAMTSLLLMLQAPTWQNLQFIGGCLLMVIAAYWAGQTIRTLLESFRIAAPDETEKEIRELSAELQARLPIDVVNNA